MTRKLKFTRFIQLNGGKLFYTMDVNKMEVFYTFSSNPDTFYISDLEEDENGTLFFTHAVASDLKIKYVPKSSHPDFVKR